MSIERDQCVSLYLKMVQESTDPEAFVDEKCNIYFEELDELRGCCVPVKITAEQAEHYVKDMGDFY